MSATEWEIRTKFKALEPVMDERLKRLWAGAEADAYGDGGIAAVERATGMSRTTIRGGRDELRAGARAEDVVKRIEQGNRARSLEMKRATRVERGGESDDEVRQNLSPEYLNLWERVKSKICGSARMTRTEVFLHYAEEHPGELLEGIEEKTDAMIREYEARARSTKRELRRGPPRELVARRIAQEAERRAAAGGEAPF